MASNKKFDEGLEHIKNAEKWFVFFYRLISNKTDMKIVQYFFSMKTSLLKWRPDFDIAADEYSKAGNLSEVGS